MSPKVPLHPADRFYGAIARQDFKEAAEAVTEDAIIWHNRDSKEQSAAENREILKRFAKVMFNWTYTVQHRSDFPGGFVEEHVFSADLADGRKVTMPVCVVGHVREGKIARINEYFDPAALQPVREAAEKAQV